MPWVSQNVIRSWTQNWLQMTNFLKPLIPEINDILRAYHDEFPDGEDYTLRVFQRLGMSRVDAIGRAIGKDLDEAKRRIGRFVPQKLVEIYGPDRVYTDRKDDGDANAQPNNDPKTKTWLKNYTRHLVR